MTENIKELIEKINQEGVQLAQEKAGQIEDQARQKAKEILEKAKQEKEEIIRLAQKEAQDTSEKQKALLAQAGRDFLLVLRQEINALLDKLVLQQVHQALEPDTLSKILSMIIKESCLGKDKEVVILISHDAFARLGESFLTKLKEEARKGITLRADDGISAGLVMSFDAGKSQFDFSDKALAEYIITFLKPKLKEVFKD